MCDCGGIECPLQITTNTPYGALGEESIYTHIAEAIIYEKATIQIRYK